MLMGEFLTAVKERLPVTVVVIKNGTLGQIKWEQMLFLGNPEYGCDLPSFDFATFAEAAGGLGFSVREPGELRPALEQALAADRPALIEVAVDPNEPLPVPSLSAKQAVHMAEALAKGTPGGKQIALTLFRNQLADLVGTSADIRLRSFGESRWNRPNRPRPAVTPSRSGAAWRWHPRFSPLVPRLPVRSRRLTSPHCVTHASVIRNRRSSSSRSC